ncbi:MAG: phosphatase PAP2 family protein [Clostridia bacterium]|nr:phosphatase PAP2 family protein [Clostridia bacterium]
MTLAGNHFFFGWEVSLMEWLQSVFSQGVIAGVSQLSALGEEIVMIAVMGFLYWCWDKEWGKYMGMNVLVAMTWNPMVKNIFLRYRPYMSNETVKILRPVNPDADVMDVAAQGYSFPSGHSTCSASMYGSLAAYKKNKTLTVLALLLPLLVGFSRVTVGAHYPTDVLVGWALGVAALFIVPWLQRKIKSRAVFYGVLLLTTIPGLFYCKSEDYFTCFGLLVGTMIALPLEEKYVRFENTRSPIRIILRLVGGAALYFGLNTLLKLPFPKDFLAGNSVPALLVRAVRYMIIAVLLFAVYPMVFRYTAKIGKQSEVKA